MSRARDLADSADKDIAGTLTVDAVDVQGTVTADGLTVDTDTLYVDATNNRVGIGTDSPSARLTVSGNQSFPEKTDAYIGVDVATSSGNGGDLTVKSGSGNGAGNTSGNLFLAAGRGGSFASNGYIAFGISQATDTVGLDQEYMRIDSAGNVGIGTSSPVTGTGVTSLTIYDTSPYIYLQNPTSGTTGNDGFSVVLSGSDAYINNRENGNMLFYNSGAERMRIDSSGNVGIGTNDPKFNLQTANGGLDSRGTGAGIAIRNNIYFDSGDKYLTASGAASTQYFDGNGNIIFYNTGTASTGAGNAVTLSEAMRITSSGNVGIGTTNPTTKLDVIGSARIYGELSAFGDQTSATNRTIITHDGSSAKFGASGDGSHRNILFYTDGLGTERMRIDTSGNVGIGTGGSNPTQRLQVDGGAVRITGNYGSIANNQGLMLGYSGDNANYYAVGASGGGVGQHVFYGYNYSTGAGSERMRIDSSGRLLVGTPTSPSIGNGQYSLISSIGNSFSATSNGQINIGRGALASSGLASDITLGVLNFTDSAGAIHAQVFGQTDATTGVDDYPGRLIFSTTADGASSPTERMRIDSSGALLVGKASRNFNVSGLNVEPTGDSHWVSSGVGIVAFNRLTNDGTLIEFAQAGAVEGTISVSGSTVSYNGGHLARWSRLADDSKDTSIVKGTVMTNLDEMVVWSHDAVDEVLDEDGNVVTEAKEAYTEDNEQLNKMAVSSVEGDTNVAGVFVNWDEDDDWNDMNIAMTGDMVIRIASGTTVARGDLLMSAGDGTAKPQGDDIVRSKTIAKVTSTHVSHTYDDGSYLVPCVLMAC